MVRESNQNEFNRQMALYLEWGYQPYERPYTCVDGCICQAMVKYE